MDIDATYREMFEAMRDGDEYRARELAEAARDWLRGEGFYPRNHTRTEVDAYVANVLRRTAHVRL